MGEPVRQLHPRRPAVTLDALVADPGVADELSEADVAQLLVRVYGVAGTLQARLMRRAVLDARAAGAREQILSRREVGRRINRSVKWIEKHLDILPPQRGTGWREADIDEWIRHAARV